MILITDRFSIQAVIVGMIFIAVSCIGGAIFLSAVEKTVPEFLMVVGGGAVTGLGAILSRTSSSSSEEDPDGPSRVTVTTDVTSDETKVTEPRRAK